MSDRAANHSATYVTSYERLGQGQGSDEGQG